MDTNITGNIHDFYVRRSRWIAERDNIPAATLPDAKAWSRLRPEIHRRFMVSLGLDSMPVRCALCPRITGSFQGPGYVAQKIAYQLLPDCWGSAHLYRPDPMPKDRPTPAVLYACGHDFAGVIGSQHHAMSWARRGYTCLIFDTIEQHDNPGDHHGLNRGRTPHWIAMGYSAAGGEVFNGLRALDLLLEQPGVDPMRVGVTGISGGGAQSVWLAAADSRLCAVAAVAGVSDPAFAIPNRQVRDHCDCMYVRNVFAHDLSLYTALIAPRALLYCFARHDCLYTPGEFRDLHRRSRTRFERLGCGDCCALCEYDGPHGYNHRDTTDTINQWFDRHVAGQPHPDSNPLAIAENGEMRDEPTLSVFHGQPPDPNRLDLLPQLLSPRGRIRLPMQPSEWPAIRQAATDRLRQEAFPLLDDIQHAQRLEPAGQWIGKQGVHRYAWRGGLDGMEQRLLQVSPKNNRHEMVMLALDDRRQQASALVDGLWHEVGSCNLSIIGIEPRAAGLNAFCEDNRNYFNREGCLVGLTPTMMMIQELHHMWPHIRSWTNVRDRKLCLYGKGEGAIAMLFHALMHPDPTMAAVILENLPDTLANTIFQVMGVMRVLDIPQAVGLLAPTPVALINPGGTCFPWYAATRAYERTGGSPPLLHETHVAAVFKQWGMQTS